MTTFLGNSMGCSSAALLAADQSDHYDTPWEFKNRALAAALGHQRQQQQQKHWQLTTEEEKKQEKATTNLDEKKGKQCSGNGVEQRQNQQQKRLSFPNGNQKQRQKTQKEMSQKQQQPSNAHICCMSSSISESASSNFPLLGLMPAAPKHSRWRSHQEKRRPADTDVHYHSPPMASPPPLTVNGSNSNASAGPSSSADEFRPPLPAHNHSHQQNGPSHTRAQSLPQSANGQMPSKTTTKLPNSTPSSAKNSTSKLPSNSSANFRKSPSFCRQQSAAITTPAARLPAPPIATISSSSAASSSSANSSTKSQPNAKGRSSKSGSNGQQSIGQQPLRSYPLVTVGPGSPNTAKQVLAFCQQQCFTEAVAEQAEDLAELVHERMERTEAEVLLAPLPLGAHLLRRRPDHSLALSLRGTDGVLHIKLEHRQAQGGWVLGEGPRFGRVRQMLRAYRRKELPVRGAEQVRLGLLLRPVEVPSRGLLLL